jgi:hypothetical protein
MAGNEQKRRRFVTRHDVEDAAAAGRPVQLRDRDVLTDEAAQRAMDLGVDIEREGGPARTNSAPSSRPSGGSGSTDDLKRAVRTAVVAELGTEPAGLDEVIERVLKRRR